MIFIPQYMMPFMVDSKTVIAMGTVPLIIAGLAQPGFAIGIITSAALVCGSGRDHSRRCFVAVMTGMVLPQIIVVLVLLAVFIHIGHAAWGLIAVWISIFTDLNYRAVFNTIVFRRGKWKTRKV